MENPQTDNKDDYIVVPITFPKMDTPNKNGRVYTGQSEIEWAKAVMERLKILENLNDSRTIQSKLS